MLNLRRFSVLTIIKPGGKGSQPGQLASGFWVSLAMSRPPTLIFDCDRAVSSLTHAAFRVSWWAQVKQQSVRENREKSLSERIPAAPVPPCRAADRAGRRVASWRGSLAARPRLRVTEGEHVTELVPVRYAELGEGPVQVRADRAG
jgi:hypothetical protein